MSMKQVSYRISLIKLKVLVGDAYEGTVLNNKGNAEIGLLSTRLKIKMS